jgi:hypothetical protein
MILAWLGRFIINHRLRLIFFYIAQIASRLYVYSVAVVRSDRQEK